MIKIEGKLLIFDKPCCNGFMFSKDCKIDIPDVIPICNVDTTSEPMAMPIGHIVSTARSETNLAVEGVIINNSYEDLYRALMKEYNIYFGGVFACVEDHDEDGVDVVTSATLHAVGIFTDDIYGDDSCRVYITEEVKDND